MTQSKQCLPATAGGEQCNPKRDAHRVSGQQATTAKILQARGLGETQSGQAAGGLWRDAGLAYPVTALHTKATNGVHIRLGQRDSVIPLPDDSIDLRDSIDLQAPEWICGRSRSKGFGVIRFIVAIPLVLIGLVIIFFLYCEARKAYWDYRVKEMCEKDGGGKVLQTVELSEQEYVRLLNKFGKFEIPLDGPGAGDAPIVQKQTSTYIRRNDPEVRQDQTTIIRKSDSAILARSIIYSRVGGDLIAFHPSYYSCPKKPVDIYSTVVNHSGANK
jgi:hypothetical protein